MTSANATPQKRSLSEYSIGDLVEPPYFEGVFTSEPTGLGPDPWSSEGWIKNCEELASAIRSTRSSRSGPASVLQRRPLIRRTIKWLLYGHPDFPSHLADFTKPLAQMASSKKISVIDVGGGFGDNYFYLSQVLPAEICNIDYHIVDNQRSIALGTDLFRDCQHRPTFHSVLPLHLQFDVSLLVGTLHYVRDPLTFLASIKQMTSERIFLARSPISPLRSFVTLQTICPPLGELRGRKAGVSAVHVVSEPDLSAAMLGPGGWMIQHRKLQENYRRNFARLDPGYRDVAYINFIFARRSSG